MPNETPSLATKPLPKQAGDFHPSYHIVDRLAFQNNVKNFLDGNTEVVGSVSEEPIQNSTQKTMSPKNIDLRSHLENLWQLRDAHEVRPEAEDFILESISLSHRLTLPESDIRESLRNIIHKKIILKEREANLLLAEYMEKYGRHPLVHAACREYFTTELLNLQRLYWRPDPRGHRIRLQAQEICSQALVVNSWLTSAEKHILIHATGCFPQDAETCWRDITRKRLSYLAMETIKEIQENGNRNISRIFDDSKTSIG